MSQKAIGIICLIAALLILFLADTGRPIIKGFQVIALIVLFIHFTFFAKKKTP